MSVFLAKRLITLIATLIGASAVVFVVLEILPGNAAQILMGPDASPDAVHALAVQLGIDRPPMERYWHWVSGMLVGDLGQSYAYSTPVRDLILERLALTVPLAVMAMVISPRAPAGSTFMTNTGSASSGILIIAAISG